MHVASFPGMTKVLTTFLPHCSMTDDLCTIYFQQLDILLKRVLV